ncbi:MAG TPA: dTDP-4-dehydrorhamnose 3,5-epimerase family protein [Candidatus Saccharimonadales bacterium]|jgi:dTDP-4-dehydrorhamnose 3,5-epimerase|nr:dTDP-4-dehydrorhamnose 3,5-epimerase family protein [Candidatus Saccharimonadales bacterium]
MAQTTFEIVNTSIDGLFSVKFKVFEDERGSVMEFYRQSDFVNSGLPSLNERSQINAPLSVKGAIRGIHAEFAHKLVAVACGNLYAVIVDLRNDSPTAGKWQGFNLSRGQGLFVSNGLGNSFQSTSDEPSIYIYYFEKEWRPDMPGKSCNPLDPTLAIDWPIKHGEGMILSDKDSNNPSLEEVLRS